jgi:hypothetical protein
MQIEYLCRELHVTRAEDAPVHRRDPQQNAGADSEEGGLCNVRHVSVALPSGDVMISGNIPSARSRPQRAGEKCDFRGSNS